MKSDDEEKKVNKVKMPECRNVSDERSKLYCFVR